MNVSAGEVLGQLWRRIPKIRSGKVQSAFSRIDCPEASRHNEESSVISIDRDILKRYVVLSMDEDIDKRGFQRFQAGDCFRETPVDG